MDASVAAPVLRLAGIVTDPRRHNRLHPLPEMIVMALVAVLCGADGWDDVADFCLVREGWFKSLLSLPRGIPSHDTFGRVFARLDPLQLEEVLRRWMNALNVASGGKLIAVDGKSLRRSFGHAWDTSPRRPRFYQRSDGMQRGKRGVFLRIPHGATATFRRCRRFHRSHGRGGGETPRLPGGLIPQPRAQLGQFVPRPAPTGTPRHRVSSLASASGR